ncbi:scarecrow-like protein 33 [Malus domestica]|uniref:scarecrow-like protein 33 n=1 Tax=Malus domestica TaxID=3750 RepID=UPI0039764489
MDHPTFNGSPDYLNGFSIDDLAFSPDSTQFSNLTNEYQFNQFSPDLNFMDNHFSLPPDFEQGNIVPKVSLTTSGESFVPSKSLSPPDGGSLSLPTTVSVGGADSSSDDSDFSEAIFKYVNQILLEENIEKKPCMFYDPLGLRVTEKSFYDVLGQQYPFSPNQQPLHINPNVESPGGNNSGSCSDCSGSNSSSSPGTSNSIDPQWVGDSGEQKPSFPQASLPNDSPFQFNSHSSSQLSVPLENRMTSIGDGRHVDDMLQGSSVEEFVAQNIFTDSDSMLQFQRGLEEASKFLPKSTQLLVDLESNTVSPEVKASVPMVVTVKKEKGERKNSRNGSKGRKNREREDVDLEEGRSSKQSAVYIEKTEESELSEMFDKVLLSTGGNNESQCGNVAFKNEASKTLQPSGQPQGSNGNGGKARGKKQGKKKETVDLRNLLILCAQAVSTNDFRTTSELLKQVRQHASPNGDGSQRLAHFFANGLEARMGGTDTGTQKFYTSLAKRSSAVDVLKSYHVHLSACPFKRMCMLFKNKMILKMAEKATTLHIVDFGILYGFQWPILIQHLSKRHGGPPKLRITGIEVPQPGFRPAEWIEETGRRLGRYCERFGVPFEYNAIASQNWESIQLEDLKTERNEVLAVNCMLRFKNLLDETVEVNCPRDAVLNLIRKMKPDIFVHSIINGSYNAPFFVTRFREALFHYSSLYDAFDINIPRDNEERLRFESEFYGREAMNVIACEGVERVERPETYKQWQVRCMRAGLQPLQLDQDLVKILKDKVKAWYHKDFVVDQDSDWMLQGWKGRIVYASSCWVPA